MFWLLPRTALALLFAALGAGLGGWLGEAWGHGRLGAMLGAGAAAALVALVDGLRGDRLLTWLSSEMHDGAPPLVGFWGEAGVRVERALRLRERALSAEREQLAQMLEAIDASPNGVLLLDAADQIEWMNQMAAAHLGLDPLRDQRQHVTHLVRAPAFVAHLQARQFEQPVQIPGAQGKGLLAVLVRPYGQGKRLLLTQDITERERVDATKRDFVANVSHEIRTPLTVLAGFVETMATLPLTEVERQRVLSLMGQQAKRMQALVGDLLTLARLEGSARPPADQWCPVARLTQVVEQEVRALSAGRHELIVDTGALEALAGQESELSSALGNLAFNAVRYTPEGGRIQIIARRGDDGSGELSVVDTGPGIAPEHLPRLAERFYRVDGSRSRDTGGTGLGLAIVKHVAQRHGGELLIESAVGQGSRFTLRLPPSRVRAAAVTPA
ncbi:phosphate regulon sensor histidine kinase PhoR [Ideonella sp. 4Y16]|uniref:Phosphate regulon sensor protein PhoR n=1 Tax=Ideonella alba TaxID=2824118 RepID=A0A940YD22_9BURK|nr:phosphate regulon sensor histidine kinase PhoR [Ideonella alba]MBQ0932901.1 phosphate regulon sensor histidine kinase PhoR [Ideonella alba]MBQ0942692.1 phosphate regulon sensor histidine kinase PhoR [Ideonella alba]